jgi:hypothetical protein
VIIEVVLAKFTSKFVFARLTVVDTFLALSVSFEIFSRALVDASVV